MIIRKQYEEDLERRQKEHLDRVHQNQWANPIWKPCAHDQCMECHGTGIKSDGSPCVHNLYCDCPKCTTYCNVYTVSGTSDNITFNSDTTVS